LEYVGWECMANLKSSVRKKQKGVTRHEHATHRGTDDHPFYAGYDYVDDAIATVSGVGEENAAAILVNAGNIDTVSGTVDSNTSAIEANTASIAVVSGTADNNTSDIAVNTAAIVDNTTSIAVVSGTADDNAAAIVGNTNLIATTSGTLRTDIDANASAISTLDTKIDTTSGTLQSAIDDIPVGEGGSTTLSGLTDTPAGYDDGKVLTSTVSGTEWAASAGGDLVDDTSPELGGDLDTGVYTVSGTGPTYTGDHLSPLVPQVSNVMYGTDVPTISGVPIGTVYIQII